MKKTFCLVAAVTALIFTACERSIPDEDLSKSNNAEAKNVTLNFSPYVTEPLISTTRGSTENISNFCSRLNVAIFNSEGSKVATESQKQGDEGFGSVSFNLAEGTYQVVAIAHNCEGNATLSSIEKVTFPNNKVTDTFYYYGSLTVTGEPQDLSIEMERVVSLFRLTITDDIPASVAQLKFYYTGGSSTLSPKSGFGVVNSKQNEVRVVSPDSKTFDIFTIPKSATGTLKVTVTALDANGMEIKERIFEDVPIKLNSITEYKGDFFQGTSGIVTQSSCGFTADPTWGETNTYTF